MCDPRNTYVFRETRRKQRDSSRIHPCTWNSPCLTAHAYRCVQRWEFYMPTQELDIQSESGHRIIDTPGRYRLPPSPVLRSPLVFSCRCLVEGKDSYGRSTRSFLTTRSEEKKSETAGEARAQTFDLFAVKERRGSERTARCGFQSFPTALDDENRAIERVFSCYSPRICSHLSARK
ncbi:unnamed protein product [Lasius platythorax]|uniref:Uncharacterized protein n=1 Tax=Lasius platythorax TaxID=488582 RepID=A0AAV2NMC1_9HYME